VPPNSIGRWVASPPANALPLSPENLLFFLFLLVFAAELCPSVEESEKRAAGIALGSIFSDNNELKMPWDTH